MVACAHVGKHIADVASWLWPAAVRCNCRQLPAVVCVHPSAQQAVDLQLVTVGLLVESAQTGCAAGRQSVPNADQIQELAWRCILDLHRWRSPL